jgi:hypothetical protein
MFSIIVAFMLSIQGTWILPVKDFPTNLTIVQRDSKLVGLLKLHSDRSDPSLVVLTGNISKRKCGTHVSLRSRYIKFSKDCKIKTTLLACGVLSKDVFTATSTVAVTVSCKGRPSETVVDDITGVWVRGPRKTTRI